MRPVRDQLSMIGEFTNEFAEFAPFVRGTPLVASPDTRWRLCLTRVTGVVVSEPRDEPEPGRPGGNEDEAPETPPTDPPPVPVQEPPSAPGQDGPYVV